MGRFRLFDRQGSGVHEDDLFETRKEVREHLISFHSADFLESMLKKMTLNELLDLGDWDLMKVSATDEKVIAAVLATMEFIANAQDKGTDQKFTESGGLTIYGCEVRNLSEYKEMLWQDKRTLSGRLRELYYAI